jgi:hypothetical protein
MKLPKIPDTVKRVVSQSFTALLVIFMLILLVEEVFPNTIQRYINPNYMLIVVIALGIPSVLWSEEKPKKKQPITRQDYILMGAFSLTGFGILYYKLQAFPLGIVISIVGGVLIFLLSYLVLEE